MSKQEREMRACLCMQIADYSYSILQKRDIVVFPHTEGQKRSKEVLQDIWIPLWNQGINPYTGRKNNSQLYQYNNLYVSNNYYRAVMYAKNSFILGETGNVAYWMYQAARRFGEFLIDALEETKDAFKEFDALVNEKREPVVVILRGIRKQDIQTENGRDIDWDDWGDDISDKDCALSFRILNSAGYDLATMKYCEVN